MATTMGNLQRVRQWATEVCVCVCVHFHVHKKPHLVPQERSMEDILFINLVGGGSGELKAESQSVVIRESKSDSQTTTSKDDGPWDQPKPVSGHTESPLGHYPNQNFSGTNFPFLPPSHSQETMYQTSKQTKPICVC